MAAGYVGRFAPSPTGPLHFGSLVAALGSYLDAKAHHGRWLLRMEDVDTPRNVPGAADSILRILEAYGFEWDGTLLWQSARQEAYQAALDQLLVLGKAYGCVCSRREIADSATGLAVDGGKVYPGTCRSGLAPGLVPRAWRLRVSEAEVCFQDRLQGLLCQQLERDVGDFVLRRADGLFAYQLAVVVDDAWQGVSHVVRGADLLDSTPRQIWLQQQLGLAPPTYAHLPVVANEAGEKLSKQTLAQAVEVAQAGPNLVAALAFLGQDPPPELARTSVSEIWRWAGQAWRFDNIPRGRFGPQPRLTS